MIAAFQGSKVRRVRPSARCTAVIAVAAMLSGCGSISSKMSETVAGMPGVGLPAGVPERPAEPRAFPAVHDMPPQRTTAVLSADEQRRAEGDLTSARDQQQKIAHPPPPEPVARKKPAAPRTTAATSKPAARPAAAATPNAVPTSSSRMIY